jgi:hypothetical protein
LAENLRASMQVKVENRTSSYITYAPYFPKLSLSRGTESLSKTFPLNLFGDYFLIQSQIELRSVVFPAPEDPMMNNVSPGFA